MPNSTTRLGLVQPLTSEAYDVSVHNGNMAIIDAAPANLTLCTVATRPSTPDAGDLIYETDSKNLLARIASAWEAHNGKFNIGTSGAPPGSTLTYGGFPRYDTDTGNSYVRNAANTVWLWAAGPAIPSGTQLVWGGDTNIYRGGADFLKTDDKFAAGQFAENSNAVTVSQMQVSAGNLTSTSYTPTLGGGGSRCAFTFVAPTSGKIKVYHSSLAYNSGASENKNAFEIRSGGSIGSGTVIIAATDENCLYQNGITPGGACRTTLIGSLTPGATYNIGEMFKTTSGTMTTQWRELIVVPVLF